MNEEQLARLLEHLNDREGYETKVYTDTSGYLTAGMGHKLTGDDLIKYKEGDEIPEEILLQWQKDDINTAWNAASMQASELGIEDDSFKEALTSVNFQLGQNWHKKFPKAYNALKEGDYEKAMYEIEHNSKGEASAWKAETPVRVQDFRNAIQGLSPDNMQTEELSPEQQKLSDNKRAWSYDFGITKRDTPNGFNVFLIMKSFGVPFNREKQESKPNSWNYNEKTDKDKEGEE
jgi:GH24 family phage-related lysozyme (muramidase)